MLPESRPLKVGVWLLTARVKVEAAPELVKLPVPVRPPIVSDWPFMSNVPLSMGEMLIKPPLGRLAWLATVTVPWLMARERRPADVGAMTLFVPVMARLPAPDLVKFVAVKLPESVEFPVWPPRT